VNLRLASAIFPQKFTLANRKLTVELFLGFLFSRHCPFESVTFRARLDDMSAVSDAVQQRFA
jgi:hypothetical protein